MGDYRLYLMNRFTGHIEERREFFATDDSAAILIATGWASGQPMELWAGSHKLKRWDAAANELSQPFLAANPTLE